MLLSARSRFFTATIVHDNAYKSIFSHPQAITDLLRGFVHEDWVAGLDFQSLEKLNASYVSDDLRDREDDLVWRLRLRGTNEDDWLYVYLLLEFQRTVDPHMAVRLLTYLGLLYQDLLKSGRIKHKLPPIFPLVLYNGEAPWTAALALEDMCEPMPASLATYQAHFRYFLLDEGRVSQNTLEQADNTVSSLIRVEQSASSAEVSQAMERLMQKLAGPEFLSLRRSFAVWLAHLIKRRYAPEAPLPETRDLPEMKQMLEERLDRWAEKLQLESLLKGLEKGRGEGEEIAQRRTLKRQLTRRFGTLPADLATRIDGASLDQLESWLDAVLDAATIEDVLR